MREQLPDDGDGEKMLSAVGPKGLFALLYQSFGEGWRTVLPSFVTHLSLVFLASGFELFRKGRERSSKILSCALSTSVALALWKSAEGTVGGAISTLSGIGEVMTGFLPVLSATLIGGGNVGEAAAASASLTLLIGIGEILYCKLLPGVAGCCFGLSLVSSFGGEDLNFDGIAGTLRGFFLFLSGLFGTVLTASLAVQTRIVAASDSVSMKAAKAALASMIPVIGNTVSGSLSTAAASLSLTRATLGGGVVLAILILLLPSLASLFLYRFSYSLSAGVARLFSLPSTERLLGGFRAVTDLLIASLIMSSLGFLFAVGLLLGPPPALS